MTTESILAQLAAQIAANQTQLEVNPGMLKQGQGGYSLGGMQAKNYVNQGLPPPPLGTMPMRSLEATELMSRSKDGTRPDRYGQWVAKRQMGKKAIELEKAHQAEQYERQVQAQEGQFQEIFKYLVAKGIDPAQAKSMAYMAARDEKIAQKLFEQHGAPVDAKDVSTFQKELDYLWTIKDKDPEKFELGLQKWLKEADNNGFAFQQNPDGGIEIVFGNGQRINSPEQVTNARRDQVKERISELNTEMERIYQIADEFNPSYFTYEGAMKGWLGDKLDKLALENSEYADFLSDYSSEREAYRKIVAVRVFEHRKRLTGVAGGEKEMTKIEESLAGFGDSPKAFKKALQNELMQTYFLYNQKRADIGLEPINFNTPEWDVFNGERRISLENLRNYNKKTKTSNKPDPTSKDSEEDDPVEKELRLAAPDPV